MNDDVGKYEAVLEFTGKKPIDPKSLELMKKANAKNHDVSSEGVRGRNE